MRLELSDKEVRDKIQIWFLVGFGIIGSVSYTIYGISSLVNGNHAMALTELSVAGFNIIVTAITYHINHPKFTEFYGSLPLTITTVHNFVFGGFASTGLLWCFTFPLVSMFISRRRKGSILTFTFIVFTIIFYLANKIGLVGGFIYDDFYYLMFLASFSGIAFMTYLYQAAWDYSEAAIKRQQENIISKNKDLETAKHNLENTLSKLAERNDELKRYNKIMVDRELKMIELKQKLFDAGIDVPSGEISATDNE